MRSLSYELALDMQSRGIGVFATSDPTARNIFVGDLPQDVIEGIFIVQSPSPPPHQYVDTEYTVLDVWVRAPHSDRAYNLIQSIYDTYQRRANWETTNWHVYLSHALGSYVDLDRDLEGGKMLRLSIQFICRNLNNIS